MLKKLFLISLISLVIPNFSVSGELEREVFGNWTARVYQASSDYPITVSGIAPFDSGDRGNISVNVNSVSNEVIRIYVINYKNKPLDTNISEFSYSMKVDNYQDYKGRGTSLIASDRVVNIIELDPNAGKSLHQEMWYGNSLKIMYTDLDGIPKLNSVDLSRYPDCYESIKRLEKKYIR